MKTIIYTVRGGENLYSALCNAVLLAKSNSMPVELEFNATQLVAYHNSRPEDLALIYELKREVWRLENKHLPVARGACLLQPQQSYVCNQSNPQKALRN